MRARSHSDWIALWIWLAVLSLPWREAREIQPHPLLGISRARHSPAGAVVADGTGVNDSGGAGAPPLWCRDAPQSLLSVRESGGVFCDDDASWHRRKDIAIAQQRHQQRTSPMSAATFFQENWEPDFSCSWERRIGRPGDGGKWLCDPHKLTQVPECLVYSFGSKNNFDFEDALHREVGEHCDIHSFDHTIGQSPSSTPAFVRFHPWSLGIGAKARLLNSPLKSLTEIVAQLRHWGRTLHVLKIDVEGAEADVLPSMLDDGSFERLKVQQVQLKIRANNPQKLHRLLRSFRNAGYAIFHKEPDTQLSELSILRVEYSFVKLTKAFWQ